MVRTIDDLGLTGQGKKIVRAASYAVQRNLRERGEWEIHWLDFGDCLGDVGFTEDKVLPGGFDYTDIALEGLARWQEIERQTKTSGLTCWVAPGDETAKAFLVGFILSRRESLKLQAAIA